MSKSADSPVDLDQIRELIDLLIEKEVSEFAIEREGIKVKIRRGAAEVSGSIGHMQHVAVAPPPAAGVPAAAGDPPAADAGFEDCVIVTSPMVGTFYRSPDPTSDVFVEIGSQVAEGSPLCIIEAMKLMNEIVAESGGEVAAIFVDNAEPVEYGQRLFAIRPRG